MNPRSFFCRTNISNVGDIRKTIYRVFAENNIEISFPQLDVHLKDAKTIPVDLTQKVNS